ncbi:MAG TPA: cytochrome c oxidase subunit 3 [Gammaproteobacteria bacterium]|nr:cytochrome c oxidase subunit 3 [Gammaproteobacteria bacterium]
MSQTMAEEKYHVPHTAPWSIVGIIGLFTLVFGGALWLNRFTTEGQVVLAAGAVVVLVMMFGWFGTVIRESEHGLNNEQVDRSYRWGMSFFIFSEVMFFAAFFGALFYAHEYSIPWLSGTTSSRFFTHALLWSNFAASWPTNGPARLGGHFEVMDAVGIAAINTVILLSSSVTVTIAHWGLKKDKRAQVIIGLIATVILGFTFVALQVHEYIDAYLNMNLTLQTGIYGTTFFMLTGFHGLHVTIGAIMLTVITLRVLSGHFTSRNHFGFEAVSWYWHFVDVVWLCLYIFVYWL